MIPTAIVGGGPAGSHCAICLTEFGIYPTIFDPSHPREKPCGGLISPKAQKLFPFLKQIPKKHMTINTAYLCSPKGTKNCIRLEESFLAYSRLILDKYLVDQAVKKGAKLIEEKVVGLKRKKDCWYLITQKKTYSAKILVGADGVTSLVRKRTIGSFSGKDLGLCFGYFINAPKIKDVNIIFSPNRKGYLWIIPREKNTSCGLWSTEISGSYSLKIELDMYLKKNWSQFKKIAKWAALIPNIKDLKTITKPIAGTNWMLIGDAAGHANPVTGEGIIYALADAKLAAQAIHNNSPEQFNKLWTKNFRMDFLSKIKRRKWQYNKHLLELYCQINKLRR